jgi:hypothetical protein
MKDDQCRYCISRGKLEVCLETKCNYHDLWMVEMLKEVFMDLLDGNYDWQEIQYTTGLPEKRCREISDIFKKLSVK